MSTLDEIKPDDAGRMMALEALRPRVVEIVGETITHALDLQVKRLHAVWALPFAVFGKALQNFAAVVAEDREANLTLDFYDVDGGEMFEGGYAFNEDQDPRSVHIENVRRWAQIFAALGEARIAASLGDFGVVAVIIFVLSDWEYDMTEDLEVSCTANDKLDALFTGRCDTRTEDSDHIGAEGPCIPNADGLCVWCGGAAFGITEPAAASTDAQGEGL